MTNSEIVKKWGESTVNGDWGTFNALTSNDFQLIGPGPEPLDKQAYHRWIKSIIEANTNHNNNMDFTSVSDNVFKGTVQMEGTHSKDWDLSFMGLGIIPVTGKSWKNPKENVTITVNDGKIVKCEVEVPENGGIGGILTQLGVELPQ